MSNTYSILSLTVSDNPKGSSPGPRLELQYLETSKLLYYFLDWRQRILTHFLVVIGGVSLLIQWMADKRIAVYVVLLPYILGCIASLAAFITDRINQRIVSICYDKFLELEPNLFPLDPHPIYKTLVLQRRRAKVQAYRFVLAALYIAAAVAFALGGVLTLVYSL
jgi:hypothetical protein